MQEQKIKEIISRYRKIPPDQIDITTKIDRTAVASSIMIHRMYAALANEGYELPGYWDIEDYGTLIKRLKIRNNSADNEGTVPGMVMQAIAREVVTSNHCYVGIDIEETGSMPVVSNFREDKFYTTNFSSSEISYCILQPAPLISFAGLFAAKEAIIKASGSSAIKPFNNIIIDHLPGGEPVHSDCHLSITHTAGLAVAVAILKKTHISTDARIQTGLHSPAINGTLIYFISFTAIIISIITLIVLLLHN